MIHESAKQFLEKAFLSEKSTLIEMYNVYKSAIHNHGESTTQHMEELQAQLEDQKL
jgi:hypothetical protein